MAWIFIPYEGMSNIHFGQTRDSIEVTLGKPGRVKETYTGKVRLEYGVSMPAFVFDDGRLVEIGMLPELSEPSEYKDLNLFALPERDVLRRLERADSNIRESNGFILFFGLGIALTGFHDEMGEQKAMAIFSSDHAWIGKSPTMMPISFL